jgi:two-component system cell cycle sensor histidine kinase/response regulator CckA
MKILHLEDNPTDGELVLVALEKEWPGCRVERVQTRDGFLAALQGGGFDLILSDFSMPGFDGVSALALARERRPDLPFIFLSGTIGEDNAVEALKHGATDYVIKDRMGRLVPAVRRALEEIREQRLRQTAERRLREQAELLDKARDAVCVAGLDQRVTYLNRSAEILFGRPLAEAAGRPLSHFLIHMGSAPLFEIVRQGLDADSAWAGELRVANQDGCDLTVDSRWTLVRDADGRPQSILIINTDITEQKKLKQQLLRTQRLESIGTLAGGIAHDLNNALAPILMSVELLREKLPDDRSSHLLDVLAHSAQHGASLVRQVLAFARGVEGERAELQLRHIIRDVVQLVGETIPRSITIRSEAPADLWPLRGDATQLSQILVNLCVNARDAMPKGGQLTIRAQNLVVDDALARAHSGASPGPHVVLSVADTGAGIAPEIMDRIFDPFFTTKPVGKGTGLGLSTVLGLVRSHGGFLQVQSQVGEGTEFRLHFPAAVVAPAAAVVAVPVADRPRGSGQLVLVIDDEPAVRNVLRALLENYGYRTLVAANGTDGIALYRERSTEIALVITDLMMPAMQGEEVVATLRVMNPAVRILAVSGLIEPDKLGVVPELGRLDFLPKPITSLTLLTTVHRLLRAT